ncbi:MAG: response regulator [Hyphomicrobium sp.]|uniref:response regulator transcription factor n=1 Tax=Hyphomicrobium sp. TaxID=82 RepID=UPI001320E7E1|nr:response regulator [Hyphomicrobium sp.]KAB2938012.1 MAG: response regulator [Hyphomicrobium sp.]MBZ0211061.1 response regulator [Hyphomicrobium sp.]
MHTIVVVNDEPNILEIVQSLLAAQGYGVRAFAHGAEALVALGKAPADLVITDASNHPMSGVELVRRLRHLTDVPVIFLSAWAEDVEEQLRGTELAAQGYVELPFSTDQLLQVVERALAPRPAIET